MSLNLVKFRRTRPYLYHLTANGNLPMIRSERVLLSAARLLSGSPELLLQKRTGCLVIQRDGAVVRIRDQAPLHKGNIRFEDGWNFERFLCCLNERVFFWPGDGNGPISYGMRHYRRYKEENPVILRVPFNELVAENSVCPPQFCRYNSGSPRCSGGIGSLRGPRTFLHAEDAGFSPGSVVEVAFLNQVALPSSVQQSPSPNGPWTPLQ